MVTKVCKQCGVEKDLDDFYAHSQMADGHMSKCKECVKEYQKGRPDQHKWTEHRKNQQLEYQRRRRKEHPEKQRAHDKVLRAIKAGKLERPDHCELCGKECKPHAHHWHGYDDDHVLDVQWLCAKCHRKEEHND